MGERNVRANRSTPSPAHLSHGAWSLFPLNRPHCLTSGAPKLASRLLSMTVVLFPDFCWSPK